jgi:hypothetical protein
MLLASGNPDAFRQGMFDITPLKTNDIFTINLMPEIEVSSTLGTCLKPHGTPPHYFTVHILPVSSSWSYSPGSNIPKPMEKLPMLFNNMGVIH